MVSDIFLDLLNYSTCKAFSKKVGNKKTNNCFKEAGKIFYNKLLENKLIKGTGTDFFKLKEIAKFLEKHKFVKKIIISKKENNIVVKMKGIVVSPSSKQILKEGYSPAHTMTYLMFAALKKNIKVLSVKFNKGFVEEIWKIN